MAVTMMVLVALLMHYAASPNSFLVTEGHPMAEGGIGSYTHEIEDPEAAMTAMKNKASETANEFANLTYSRDTILNKSGKNLFDIGGAIKREKEKLEKKIQETKEALEKTGQIIADTGKKVGDVVQEAADKAVTELGRTAY